MLAAYNADFWQSAASLFGAVPIILFLFVVDIWAFMMVYVLICAYGGVKTCGTSTNVWIPCMFSALGRAEVSFEAASLQENLLNILTRAGCAYAKTRGKGGTGNHDGDGYKKIKPLLGPGVVERSSGGAS
ncbi:hypothetical protein ACEWPM_004030 [Roseovarius sp. S4756]|uniref:hypothetical protein n=1 Tax=Roseovarius maritimus TaxID=3342637 RepID=UPI0037284202